MDIGCRDLKGSRVWRGREGFGSSSFAPGPRNSTTGRFELERLIDAGEDPVVALTVQTATGKGSGVPVDLHVGQVYEREDGRQGSGDELPQPRRGPGSRRAVGVVRSSPLVVD